MSRLLQRIWYEKPSKAGSLLVPGLALASGIYRVGLFWDQRAKARRARSLPCPVISIGNLTVGGVGKTPASLWLANEILKMGNTPCVLSRGHGRRATAAQRVPRDSTEYLLFGDEPLLLAREVEGGRIVVGQDRYEAGMFALSEDPDIDVFLMDDGFQHRQLNRDVDLVLVDAERGFGNARLLPWGPLREPISALRRATAIGVVTRRPEGATGGDSGLEDLFPPDIPIFYIRMGAKSWRRLGEREGIPLDQLPATLSAHLVSGIGSPAGFESTISQLGLPITGHSIFPDHHPFTVLEVEGIRSRAGREGSQVFTTAKDAVRLEPVPVQWTESDRPIIIEVGLIEGDGTDYLKSILKGLLSE